MRKGRESWGTRTNCSVWRRPVVQTNTLSDRYAGRSCAGPAQWSGLHGGLLWASIWVERDAIPCGFRVEGPPADPETAGRHALVPSALGQDLLDKGPFHRLHHAGTRSLERTEFSQVGWEVRQRQRIARH